MIQILEYKHIPFPAYMNQIELEKTYLVKFIPEGALQAKSEEILDVYIPVSKDHPTLRLRKRGRKFEITKKFPVEEKDSSCQNEHTIELDEEEFESIAGVEGKRVRKVRYVFEYEGKMGELDVFQDGLKGLILVDFEFETIKEKDALQTPDFCLADVTQEKVFAGGMLCGKTYLDIEPFLKKYKYKRIEL